MDGHLWWRQVGLVCGAFLTLGVLFTTPARADDIVAIVDEHGHRIFINTGEPVARPGPALGRTSRGFRSRPAWAGRNSAPSRFAGPGSAFSGQPTPEINTLVDKTAKQFAVDPQLVHAIIGVESNYNPNAVSHKGAMGLMQLIPATAARYGVRNPFEPRQNIRGGVSYLKYLMDLFGGDLVLSLAAYNAGEHTVLRSGGVPSITETQDYVRKVTARYGVPNALALQAGSQRANPFDAQFKAIEPESPPIYRYVDEQGVVHFSNY